MHERRPNRLAQEPSPYLKQHAHNPVDWYPWGTEAMERAVREDKPILLSIGYSACHWCHVMERESFEDDDIARQMNELFVSIKVDREERPDLDHLYQLVIQLLGRNGGWPLTVFLTPDQRPFFAGTYFPPTDRHGMPGFGRVLETVASAYRTNRSNLEAQAEEIRRALEGVYRSEREEAAPETLGSDPIPTVVRRLSSRFDDTYGGFGTAPKFPNVTCLRLLLSGAVDRGDEEAASRVRLALSAMRKGGIWDHLAGGFHRYSTDERWLVPHFEKMLYDNALLLDLYCDAFCVFGDGMHEHTARDIGAYLMREMQSEEGGFYSSQDADSPGGEGAFFVWTDSEIRSLLAQDALAAEVVRLHFGVTSAGNFETTGACVLAEHESLDAVAEMVRQPKSEVLAALDRAKVRLREARAKRTPPPRDDKVLASWNGLAVMALAKASIVLGAPEFLSAAERGFAHLDRTLVQSGRVNRLVKDGIVRGPGFLDDHAFLCFAALELFEVTGDPSKLATAARIADEILARFWTAADRIFSFAPSDAPPLIVRVEDPFDQAVPSASAMASIALLKLSALVDERYAIAPTAFLERVAASALANPFAYAQTIAALDRLVRGSTDILILGEKGDPGTDALKAAAFRAYVPNRNLAMVDPRDSDALKAVPLLVAGKPLGDAPVAYVCRGRSCSAPIQEADDLAQALRAPRSRA